MPAKLRIPRSGGLVRDRLLAELEEVWSCGICLITAPAGCGKTTLLCQFATASPLPVAWYRAEPSDGDPAVLLAHLEASARTALAMPVGRWRCTADASMALEESVGQGLLLVIDDFQALSGSPAENEIERLVQYLPHRVAVIAASRVQPGINVSRLRVSGLLEIGPDALRFRTWEVERLFRDVYGEPLPPEELAELARRTEGWAAGLRLFHLATRGKPQEQRQRTLRQLGSHSRLVREYLARNVLEDLDGETRGFLLRTAVLGRLNGRLCDRLLHTRGSDAMLTELHRQQLFTDLVDDRGWYRYHAVLRSYLETTAVEEMGEPAIREQRRLAGALLEEEEEFSDALEAYCSAGAWDDAARLLGVRGEELTAAGPTHWLDLLPGALAEVNPWVLLAAARRHLSAGRCRSAVDAYRRAETVFGDVAGAELCRRERACVAVWLDPRVTVCLGWPGMLRMATRRDPMLVSTRAAQGSSAGDRLAAGLAALLAGHVRLARTILVDALRREDSSPVVGICSRLGLVICSALGGEPLGVASHAGLIEEAEQMGLPWLAQLAGAVGRAGGEVRCDSGADAADAEDGWGPALGSLLRSWGEVRRGGGDAAELSRVAAAFAGLGAPVLEHWARGLEALAQARTEPRKAAATTRRARAGAEAVSAPGARALALAASGDPSERAAAATLAAEFGLALPEPGGGAVAASGETIHVSPRTPAGVAIRCLGPFHLTVGGRAVDLSAAKPRVRSLLRLLAIHAGRPAHRDVIATALWPEADSDTGRRNLQVAVSSLRRLLDTAAGSESGILVLREGDAYRLGLPADGVIDVADLQHLLAEGEARRRAGDVDGAVAAFGRALGAAGQDLLPEEGPAEWLLARREEHSAQLVEAALALGALHVERGELIAALAACERGLRVDRYSDPVWSQLIDIHRRSGNDVAVARAQQRYASALRELGVCVTC